MVVAVALAVGLSRADPALAATGVTFEVSVSSAYLRASPSATATPTYSVFQGQTYAITGRSADSTWVALDYAGGANGTWIRANFGTIEGNLNTVPVGASSVSAPAGTPVPTTAAGGGMGGSTSTAGPVVQNLTISVNSTFVRDAPSWTAVRIASLFQGQAVGVVARDAASQWLLIRLHPQSGWVPAGVGQLSGDILRLPVAGAGTTVAAPSATPIPTTAAGATPGVPSQTGGGGSQGTSLLAFYPWTSATPDSPMPPWIPALSAGMRAKYQLALASGRDPRMFTISGDCNSEGPYYLELVAVGAINTSGYPFVNNAIQQFRQSFFHVSIGVSGGATTSSVQNQLFSPPTLCRPGEDPFECELRSSNASIIFIMLGTGDHHDWQNFERNYRQLIEKSLLARTLPVLMTKPDGLEWQEGGAPDHYINDVIRRLGREYDVPVLDFWLAAQQMERGGLQDDPGNDFHYSAEAMGVHVMATLQTLYVIWHG
jgi:hypothetical protein